VDLTITLIAIFALFIVTIFSIYFIYFRKNEADTEWDNINYIYDYQHYDALNSD